MNMKRRNAIFAPLCLLLVAALLLGSCSRRGAHMPKHRKSRRCNCPSFSYHAMPSPAAMPTYTTAELL